MGKLKVKKAARVMRRAGKGAVKAAEAAVKVAEAIVAVSALVRISGIMSTRSAPL